MECLSTQPLTTHYLLVLLVSPARLRGVGWARAAHAGLV